jgi:hypothetical protein
VNGPTIKISNFGFEAEDGVSFHGGYSSLQDPASVASVSWRRKHAQKQTFLNNFIAMLSVASNRKLGFQL